MENLHLDEFFKEIEELEEETEELAENIKELEVEHKELEHRNKLKEALKKLRTINKAKAALAEKEKIRNELVKTKIKLETEASETLNVVLKEVVKIPEKKDQ
jgi:Mg2+ and Co2+ transporter CorA